MDEDTQLEGNYTTEESPDEGQANEKFSFRWGISLLDPGFTNIPNFILDHYIQAGITRNEFLVIVHLARYQFEQAGSECRPALATVARQMGYSVRHLRRILAHLEERGLLERHFQPGQSTIYDFSGFSRAVLAIAERADPQVTPDAHVRGRADAHVRGRADAHVRTPRTSMSAEKNNKEEDKRRTTKQGLFVVSPEQQRICTLLIDFGISESAAKELAERYEPAFVEAWLTYANQAENLHDPPAFVVSKLQTGKMPPEKRSKTRRNQYIEAKYAQYVEH